MQVACCAADGLDETSLGAKKAFLVGIEDGDQRDFRDVQALSQQVDAHENVEDAQTQVTNDLHALHRLHVGVQIAHLDPVFAQVVGELLGHALGERGDENTLPALDAQADFLQHVIHLVGGWAHFDFGVDQPRRAHNLVHDLT